MRRSTWVLAVLVVASATVAVGCGSSTTSTGGSATSAPGTSTPGTTPGGNGGALAGTSWLLQSYPGTPGSVDAVAGSSTLTFAPAGALAGSTGCNRFSGQYTVSGASLTLSLGAMTQAACTDAALNAQEAALTLGLPKVTSFAVAGTTLTLRSDNGSTFTYAAAPTGLSGTSWTATGVNNGKEAVVGTAATEKLTLMFGTDGKISGFGGCSDLSGSYTTSEAGRTVTITGVTAAPKTCDAEATTLQQNYVTALGSVATYELDGNKLTLRNAQGATQATFNRAN